MDHVNPLRLFKASQAEAAGQVFRFSDEEQKHLSECEGCQLVLRVFAREFREDRPPQDKRSKAA
jgi:hypothetical protein